MIPELTACSCSSPHSNSANDAVDMAHGFRAQISITAIASGPQHDNQYDYEHEHESCLAEA
jgi:hypothetical protein